MAPGGVRAVGSVSDPLSPRSAGCVPTGAQEKRGQAWCNRTSLPRWMETILCAFGRGRAAQAGRFTFQTLGHQAPTLAALPSFCVSCAGR